MASSPVNLTNLLTSTPDTSEDLISFSSDIDSSQSDLRDISFSPAYTSELIPILVNYQEASENFYSSRDLSPVSPSYFELTSTKCIDLPLTPVSFLELNPSPVNFSDVLSTTQTYNSSLVDENNNNIPSVFPDFFFDLPPHFVAESRGPQAVRPVADILCLDSTPEILTTPYGPIGTKPPQIDTFVEFPDYHLEIIEDDEHRLLDDDVIDRKEKKRMEAILNRSWIKDQINTFLETYFNAFDEETFGEKTENVLDLYVSALENLNRKFTPPVKSIWNVAVKEVE